MPDWPENGDPLPFVDLVAPVRAALCYAYHVDWCGGNLGEPMPDIPWTGPRRLSLVQCAVVPPEHRLEGRNLDAELLKNRDPLDVILGLAVELGIQQGRIIERRDAAERARFDRPTHMYRTEGW